MSQKRKAGRPKLPKGEAKSKIVLVRFTDAEAKQLSQAAQASKRTVSEWVRSRLLSALKPRDRKL
jgi:hypothetical protein